MTHSPSQWTLASIEQLFELPFLDLVFQAQQVHREHFTPNRIQISSLLSIKSGGCSENCSYCSQSSKHHTEIKKEPLIDVDSVVKAAKAAKAAGAGRFCMGAAWRSLKDRHLPIMIEMIAAVKALGMETCMTLGLLTPEQAISLKEAGLDYYNHNINTSREYHDQVVTTHSYDDRLQTLDHLRNAGIKICCGGIIGMGENRKDRISFIYQLANSNPSPNTVPINHLIPIKGTRFENIESIDHIEFVRTIAVARITMPTSVIRLSAGRESMSESTQALCFLAGASSIFCGDELLTVGNATIQKDKALLDKLGMISETG